MRSGDTWLDADWIDDGRGGEVAAPFQNAGDFGYYWSSRADFNDLDTYYFYFRTSTVVSSRNDYRHYAYSLRCLSTVLDR